MAGRVALHLRLRGVAEFEWLDLKHGELEGRWKKVAGVASSQRSGADFSSPSFAARDTTPHSRALLSSCSRVEHIKRPVLPRFWLSSILAGAPHSIVITMSRVPMCG